MKILLASTNGGKIERFKKLLETVDPAIEVCGPTDFQIEGIDVEETADTLLGNAELKVQAYAGKVDVPILGNDTGFYVEGEGFIETPKRTALGEHNEKDLTQEEISEKVLNFWRSIATKHGGKVDAAWIEVFVVLYPDGKMVSAESKREIILTDQTFGEPHPQMPIRSLYFSKTTNKPSILHTNEEELLELEPVTEALRKVLLKN